MHWVHPQLLPASKLTHCERTFSVGCITHNQLTKDGFIFSEIRLELNQVDVDGP